VDTANPRAREAAPFQVPCHAPGPIGKPPEYRREVAGNAAAGETVLRDMATNREQA